MSDARIDQMDETLNSLGQKVDGLSLQLHETTERIDGLSLQLQETTGRLDGRIDGLSLQLQETTDRLDGRIDGLSLQLQETTDRLDGRIDALAADVKAGFEETKVAFDDHRRYAEFLTQGVRDDMRVGFKHIERRFDSVDDRFDRLETLIKER